MNSFAKRKKKHFFKSLYRNLSGWNGYLFRGMAIFDSWVLSFSPLILILADFSSFFWTKVPNKRYRTTFPLLFNMLILFRTCFSISPTNLPKKMRLHHFSWVFEKFCLCPFIFLHFCWDVLQKKTRLHFCGVKWQKMWGILCFRASMIIPRK